MRIHFVVLAALAVIGIHTARGVILMEVIGPLTLFEIEGIDFAMYSVPNDASVRVTDTGDGFMGEIDLRGQIEPLSTLTLLAASASDPRQQVRIEVDVTPLDGPPIEGITVLRTRPVPIEPPPVEDRALAPFEQPLFLEFRLIGETPEPGGATRAEYRLERVDVPEPTTTVLAAEGLGLAALCRRRRPRRTSNDFQQ